MRYEFIGRPYSFTGHNTILLNATRTQRMLIFFNGNNEWSSLNAILSQKTQYEFARRDMSSDDVTLYHMTYIISYALVIL